MDSNLRFQGNTCKSYVWPSRPTSWDFFLLEKKFDHWLVAVYSHLIISVLFVKQISLICGRENNLIRLLKIKKVRYIPYCPTIIEKKMQEASVMDTTSCMCSANQMDVDAAALGCVGAQAIPSVSHTSPTFLSIFLFVSIPKLWPCWVFNIWM